jgi:hypothetical protein
MARIFGPRDAISSEPNLSERSRNATENGRTVKSLENKRIGPLAATATGISGEPPSSERSTL